MKLWIPALLLSSLVLWQACKDDDSNVDDFDRSTLLADVANNIILPEHQEFKAQTTTLKNAAIAFSDDPSQSNLDALQTVWHQTKLEWKDCQLFNLGPVSDQIIHNFIDKWATNPAFIENFIATEDTITQTFINGIGSTSKGLPAIEHLIYSDAGDVAIIDSFTNGSNISNRKAYLVALTENLELAASVLLDVWQASGDNYVEEFITSTGNGLDGSVNMLANEMVGAIEKLIRKNIGNALGTETGNGPDPTQTEAPYAQTSLEYIRANVVSLQSTFNGGSATAVGYDDYLNHLNAQYHGVALADTINGQFDLILSEIVALQKPLETAVVNNPTQVEAIHEALQDLLVLIKVDMASSLSITITFSDNDGD